MNLTCSTYFELCDLNLDSVKDLNEYLLSLPYDKFIPLGECEWHKIIAFKNLRTKQFENDKQLITAYCEKYFGEKIDNKLIIF